MSEKKAAPSYWCSNARLKDGKGKKHDKCAGHWMSDESQKCICTCHVLPDGTHETRQVSETTSKVSVGGHTHDALYEMSVPHLRILCKQEGIKYVAGKPVDFGRKSDLIAAILGEVSTKEPVKTPDVAIDKALIDQVMQTEKFWSYMNKRLDELHSSASEVVEGTMKRIEARVERPWQIVIKQRDVVTYTSPPTDGKDKTFLRLAKLLSMRKHVLMVGPAGCGKSTMASLVATFLKMDFHECSASGDVREQHFLGRSLPVKGEWKYFMAPFVRAFKNGGVLLIDEIDGCADPSVLLCVNNALAGAPQVHVPWNHEEPYIKRHSDFVVVATANTFGYGGDETYTAGTALDGRTIDRFVGAIIEVDYNDDFESRVVEDVEHGILYLEWIRDIRRKARKRRLNRIISTRMVQIGADLLAVGDELHEVKAAMLVGWTPDEMEAIK